MQNTLNCTNCGKFGHISKCCTKPITSYGIVAYYRKNNIIKYLLIQRKHSLGYIEFMRGRYFPHDLDSIILLFKQMSNNEKKNILEKDFDTLWIDLWKEHPMKNNLEYDVSKNYFSMIDLKKYCNIRSDGELEWCFPKGRMNYNENELKCALREFYEETNLKNVNIKFKNNLKPVKEYLIGTNSVEYINKYYVAEIDYTDDTKFRSKEVGNIGFFTYGEALNKIKYYHIGKKKILSKINKSINI